MEVLRFLFELKRERIDPIQLQSMLIQHTIHNQVRQLAAETEELQKALPQAAGMSPMDSENSCSSVTKNCDIPAPKIIFNYVPSTSTFPTPAPTPEPVQPTDMPIDYSKKTKKKQAFKTEERSKFIKLKKEAKQPKVPAPDTESDQENYPETSQLKKLVVSEKTETWLGSSIYNNLPEVAMNEYDKIMREGHSMKCDVIRTLNEEYPVSYEYNKNKSRIRTDYKVAQVAIERTRNNIASRRSRQRKKFNTVILQYSVDYDLDENFIISKQEKWLKSLIAGLEQKALQTNSSNLDEILKLRKQCGFN
jgi:Basic region leucine zipper